MNIFQGSNSANEIRGTISDDEILGGGGDDTLIASTGNDLLNGESGSDTVNYASLDTPITLERAGRIDKGESGTDQIEGIETIIGNPRQVNSIDGSENNGETSFEVRLDRGEFRELTVFNVPELGDLNFDIRNFTNVTGTDRSDEIVGNNDDNVFRGGKGDDFIRGSEGNDELRGGLGNDEIKGGSGNDTLFGGRNSDSLAGNEGNDRLKGGDGNDTLKGGQDLDTLIGSGGADSFIFGSFRGSSRQEIDVIEDFNFAEGDKVVIGFSDDINRFSENEATGEILFDGVAFAQVDGNQASDFFTPQSDIQFL